MPRNFDGTDDIAYMSVPASLSGGFGTFGILVRVGSFAATRSLMRFYTSGFVNALGLFANTSGQWGMSNGVSAPVGATTTTAGEWYLILCGKATGTTTPRNHIYRYSNNTWVHENTGGTAANASSPVGGGLTIAARVTGDQFTPSDVAVTGFWARNLSDAEAEQLPFSLGAWYASAPDVLHLWDVVDGLGVADLTGNGGNMGAITGTTFSTVSTPLLTYGDGPWLVVRPQTASTTPVEVSVNTAWHVRGAPTQTSTTEWHVRAAISKTAATAWHVRAALAQTAASAWHVRAALAQTAASAWNVRAAVTPTRAAAWHVRAALSKTQDTAWSVRSAVTTVTTAAAWHVRAALTQTKATEWNVASLSGLSEVTQTTVTAWHVRAALTQTSTTEWHVREVFPFEDEYFKLFLWKVRKAVAQTRDTAWHVRSAVEVPIYYWPPVNEWHVRQAVSTSIATAWHVETSTAAVEVTSAAAWHVRAAVSPAAIAAWHVRTALAQTAATAWAVRTSVTPVTRASAWMVRAAALQSRATAWHTRAAVSLSQETAWGPYRSLKDRTTYEFLPSQDGSSDFVHGGRNSPAEYVQTNRHSKSEFIHSRR
jgi:hypothetical protein